MYVDILRIVVHHYQCRLRREFRFVIFHNTYFQTPYILCIMIVCCSTIRHDSQLYPLQNTLHNSEHESSYIIVEWQINAYRTWVVLVQMCFFSVEINLMHFTIDEFWLHSTFAWGDSLCWVVYVIKIIEYDYIMLCVMMIYHDVNMS